MTIARGQMNRQLYADGSGIKSLLDIIASNPEQFGDIINILEGGPNDPRRMSDEDREVMENLRLKQMAPEYQYDEENLYEGPRDMRMYGGVPRQQYGLGSFVKSIAKTVKKVADPVAQVASFVPGPHQPFAAAYTAARGAGIGGDNYGGLQIGGFTPSGGSFGIGGATSSPFSSFAPMSNNPASSFGLGSFNIPGIGDVQTAELLRTASQMTQDPRSKTGGGNIFGQTQTPTSTADIIGRVLQGGLSLYGAKKSYDDQKRINEARQREYDEYVQKREAKREQYGLDNTLSRLPVTNRTRAIEDVVRRPAAAGGVIKGLRGLSKLGQKTKDDLDEAYEMVTSRGDFEFNDYKMRGRLMAEELSEIRFKKDFDDLDQRTQLDLYSEASDYLNNVAADYADDMRDMMKERFGKAEGGVMDLDVRTNPEGIQEIDYREKGGFVPPIGIKEKADDIPAMLSNNEFVFTADAVRAAGGGSVNKGAQKMYALMKELEAKA